MIVQLVVKADIQFKQIGVYTGFTTDMMET